MKLIPEDLIKAVQRLLSDALHQKYTWTQVAEVKRLLMALEDVPQSADEQSGDRGDDSENRQKMGLEV